jgi:hypothetical protein
LLSVAIWIKQLLQLLPNMTFLHSLSSSSVWKASALLGLLSLNGAAASLDPIVIKGSKFFFKTNGTQFYIKGVAYQQGIGTSGSSSTNTTYTDPLADTASCQRDIPLLQALGANTIRTYALDPTADHDECMALLDAAGIYLVSDLSEPATSINRDSPTWDLTLYNRYTSVVDAMEKYTNVIGFFAGNEVVNNASVTNAAPAVKAAVRDTKAYIKSKGYRAMGVGYAADDDPSVRANMAAYLNCGDASESIDFWGYNIYEWCGNSNYILSGYNDRVTEFQDYNVPVFFAEYGCNTGGGGVSSGAANRPFTEVDSLYSSNMTGVFSGGIVFEYFEETNDFGLVSVDGTTASTLADYNSLSSKLATNTPSATASSAYSPSNTAAQACPTANSTWQAASSPLPPTPDADVCNCMMSTLDCIIAPGTSDDIVGALFGVVCGESGSPCNTGIQNDAESGSYGAFLMCNATERLSFALNTYYKAQGSTSQACSFGGNGTVVSDKAASSCSSVFSSATAAAGTVAASGSGGSGGAASSTTKKSEGVGMVGASLAMGKWIGLYVLVALFSGAGMIWL